MGANIGPGRPQFTLHSNNELLITVDCPAAAMRCRDQQRSEHPPHRGARPLPLPAPRIRPQSQQRPQENASSKPGLEQWLCWGCHRGTKLGGARVRAGGQDHPHCSQVLPQQPRCHPPSRGSRVFYGQTTTHGRRGFFRSYGPRHSCNLFSLVQPTLTTVSRIDTPLLIMTIDVSLKLSLLCVMTCYERRARTDLSNVKLMNKA